MTLSQRCFTFLNPNVLPNLTGWFTGTVTSFEAAMALLVYYYLCLFRASFLLLRTQLSGDHCSHQSERQREHCPDLDLGRESDEALKANHAKKPVPKIMSFVHFSSYFCGSKIPPVYVMCTSLALFCGDW